jgi:muramoyltetrapeptide carboxypeptidase
MPIEALLRAAELEAGGTPERIRPPRLREGDRVMLITPAGPVPPEKVGAAVGRCIGLGLEPVLAPAAGKRTGYLAGTDEERAADLNRAMAEENIAAIWAIRGGYGTMRLLRLIDPTVLRSRPRAFIGFSDNTALHLCLDRLGIVSFHGPHAGSDAFTETTETCFRRVLFRAEAAGPLPRPPLVGPPVTLVPGTATAPLIGGNLAMLAASCGTPFALRARGRIVFMEDVGEPLYRIDRMLTQLLLAGALDGAAGIAFGCFSDTGAEKEDFSLEEVLRDRVAALGIPTLMNLPFGHVAENWTLPVGVNARLDADAGTLEIVEPAVE